MQTPSKFHWAACYRFQRMLAWFWNPAFLQNWVISWSFQTCFDKFCEDLSTQQPPCNEGQTTVVSMGTLPRLYATRSRKSQGADLVEARLDRPTCQGHVEPRGELENFKGWTENHDEAPMLQFFLSHHFRFVWGGTKMNTWLHMFFWMCGKLCLHPLDVEISCVSQFTAFVLSDAPSWNRKDSKFWIQSR